MMQPTEQDNSKKRVISRGELKDSKVIDYERKEVTGYKDYSYLMDQALYNGKVL